MKYKEKKDQKKQTASMTFGTLSSGNFSKTCKIAIPNTMSRKKEKKQFKEIMTEIIKLL
jgi:hypothetical protein